MDIINSIDADRVMFVPDANLGSWVQDYTDKELILWEGYCHVHHRVSVEGILRVKAVHENAFMIAHPECRYEVTQMADVVCSTSKMKQAAEQAEPDTIIVVTEGGILHRLKDEVPDKTFVLASSKLVCSYMKENTPELLFETLELGNNEILLSKDIMKKASLPLERMLELTAGGGQS